MVTLVSVYQTQHSVVTLVALSLSVIATVWVCLLHSRKSNTSLLSKNNSLERAVDWIFSHIDDLDAEAAMDISEGRSAADSISESVPVGPKVRDGPGSECPQESG